MTYGHASEDSAVAKTPFQAGRCASFDSPKALSIRAADILTAPSPLGKGPARGDGNARATLSRLAAGPVTAARSRPTTGAAFATVKRPGPRACAQALQAEITLHPYATWSGRTPAVSRRRGDTLLVASAIRIEAPARGLTGTVGIGKPEFLERRCVCCHYCRRGCGHLRGSGRSRAAQGDDEDPPSRSNAPRL